MIFDMRSVFVMCTLAALLPASRVAHADSSGVAQQYEQCGGSQYSGPTTCADGLTCTYANDSYSQCLRSDGSAALAQQYEQCGGANYDGPTTCTTGLNCVRRNENYSQCLAAGSAGGGGDGGVADTGGTPSSPPRVPGPMGTPDPANPRSSPVAGDNCEIEEGAACGPGAEFMQCCADLVASGPSFPQRFLHCAAPDGSTTGSTICRNCGKPGEQCCNNSIEGQPKAGAVGESGCAQDISPTSFNTLQGLVGGAAGTIQCREGMCLRVCDTGTGDECPEVPFCDEDPTGQNCPPIAS